MTKYHYVAQASLELMTLLPQFLKANTLLKVSILGKVKEKKNYRDKLGWRGSSEKSTCLVGPNLLGQQEGLEVFFS